MLRWILKLKYPVFKPMAGISTALAEACSLEPLSQGWHQADSSDKLSVKSVGMSPTIAQGDKDP